MISNPFIYLRGQAYYGEKRCKGATSMKKMMSLFILGLIVYTIYTDLTAGALHKLTPLASPTITSQEMIPYEAIEIKQGETVLTALEKLNGTLPVSIETALQDFQQLNPGVDPMVIKADHVYKFPIYKGVSKQF